jgi:hypothetical protein
VLPQIGAYIRAKYEKAFLEKRVNVMSELILYKNYTCRPRLWMSTG